MDIIEKETRRKFLARKRMMSRVGMMKMTKNNQKRNRKINLPGK
jgi:hypothetical protein